MKKRRYFPDPLLPTFDGVVTLGDDLSLPVLLEAYENGIFPWPQPELPCLWFCPDRRGVLDFDHIHVGRSLRKFMNKTELRISFDQAFSEVIKACAEVPRQGQAGTWITPQILSAYEDFHNAGYAHSVECWLGNHLVGGLYGVFVKGVFSGESMFYKVSNASKLCLLSAVAVLQRHGIHWMDIQMLTPVTEQLGGQYISKPNYISRLRESQGRNLSVIFPASLELKTNFL